MSNGSMSELSDSELLSQLSDEELKALAGANQIQYSPMQAAIGSAVSGATMGYLPQIQAALKTGSVSSPEYIAERDLVAQELAQASEQQPVASALGGLIGTAGVPLGVGRVSGGTARTAGQLARKSAIAGGLYGAFQNPGDVPGELSPLQLSERLKGAAEGAAAGGATGLALGAVATPGGRRAIKDIAEERAFKATGPYAREARQAFSKGQVRPIGRAMLDEGVIGNIPPGQEKIAKRAGEAAERVGAEKGKVIDELADFEKRLAEAFRSEAGGNLPAKVGQGMAKDVVGNVGVSRAEIAKSLRERLISDLPEAGPQNRRFEALIRKFEQEGDALVPLKEADALKQKYGKQIKWDRLPQADIPPQEQYYRAVYDSLNKGVDDAATVLADTYSEVVGKDMSGRLARTKKRYGALKTAQGIAEKREAREFANRLVSPSDYGMGIGGAAIGMITRPESIGPAVALGVGAGAVNQLARKYGNQLTAKQLDNLQKMFSRIRAGTGTAGAIGAVSASPMRQRRLQALEGK